MISRAHEIETTHNGKQVLRQLVLFNRIDYILGTGVIELEINKYAIQYLFDHSSSTAWSAFSVPGWPTRRQRQM